MSRRPHLSLVLAAFTLIECFRDAWSFMRHRS